jgi:excisionase family DNA binding protein
MAKIKIEVEIEDAYEVKEAALALGVGEATVWRWLRENTLHAVKLQGRTLVTKKEVEAIKAARAPGVQELSSQGSDG